MDRSTILDIAKLVISVIISYCIVTVGIDDVRSVFTWKSTPSFIGEEYWSEAEQNLCDDLSADKTHEYYDSNCYIRYRGFEEVRVEVLSWTPPLVVYRGLFSKTQVDNYFGCFKKLELKEAQVVDHDGYNHTSTVRRANGTSTPAHMYPEAQSLADTASRLIPSLDFHLSENILGLSYLTGGHYAVHYDFLFTNETQSDAELDTRGNRMATFIMVFQAAEEGGGTMFPSLGTTVRAQPGDAILWFNQKENLDQEEYSNHAGCPVRAGQKVISTIWLRAYGQRIFNEFNRNRSFDASFLLR